METTVAVNESTTIIDDLVETNRVLQGDNQMEGMSIELAKKLASCRQSWIRDSSKINAMNDMVDGILKENKKMRIKIYRSNRSEVIFWRIESLKIPVGGFMEARKEIRHPGGLLFL
ncbi:unnamed protein product [Caenorhabditis brenneri]